MTAGPIQGRSHRYDRLILVCLLALVAGLFGRSVRFDFIAYDEIQHVVDNPQIRSLSPSSIRQMFTDLSGRSFYPVRQLSFAIDYAIWGLNPAGYHLTNVVLHGANTCLLYLLLLRALRRMVSSSADVLSNDSSGSDNSRLPLAAAAGAALFAIHPVIVEPVAWVSGREELLMVLFGLLCLHCHDAARCTQAPDQTNEAGSIRRARSRSDSPEPSHAAHFRDVASGHHRVPASPRPRVFGLRSLPKMWHILAWLACLLACTSNAVGAIVPALVLMHDLVIRRVRSPWRLFSGNAPMWAIAVGAVLLKLSHQDVQPPGEAPRLLIHMTAWERVYTVLSLYALNWRTILWPRSLILVYPNLLVRSLFALPALVGLLLAMLTPLAIWRLRRRPLALAGLLWFLLALAPSAQVLPHHIFRADRFLYLPIAGLAWVMTAAVWTMTQPPRRIMPVGIVSAALLVALGVLNWRQTGVWRDTISVFTRCIRFNPLDAQPHNIRAIAYSEAGLNDLALLDLNRAIELEPADAGYYANRARVYAGLGRTPEAIADYNIALQRQSTDAEAHQRRGLAYVQSGQMDLALQDFGRAIALKLSDATAYFNRGNAYLQMGEHEKAITDYDAALKLEPDYAEALNNRGSAHLQRGRLDLAITDFEQAVRLDAQNPKTHNNLGAARARLGQLEQALPCFDRAIAINPADAEPRLSRARALAALGRHEAARDEYRQIIGLQPANASAHKECGHACAAMNRPEEAIAAYTTAIELKGDDADIHNRRGILFAQQGDLNRAMADFERATQVAPSDPAGFANRALAHARMRQYDEARLDWQKVIQLDPQGPTGEKARRSLRLLDAPGPAGPTVPATASP